MLTVVVSVRLNVFRDVIAEVMWMESLWWKVCSRWRWRSTKNKASRDFGSCVQVEESGGFEEVISQRHPDQSTYPEWL